MPMLVCGCRHDIPHYARSKNSKHIPDIPLSIPWRTAQYIILPDALIFTIRFHYRKINCKNQNSNFRFKNSKSNIISRGGQHDSGRASRGQAKGRAARKKNRPSSRTERTSCRRSSGKESRT